MALMSPATAWTGVVTCVCAILILSVIAALYASGHEAFVGSIDGPPPESAPALAQNIVWAVIVYAVILVVCAIQIVVHNRKQRRGEIAL
ncbi:hypothetical protein VUR80DRAFT_4400 [Thermomyces stellatus]